MQARGPQHRTKIVATLGPSSASPGAVRCLIEAGMNVARINASHGSHEEFADAIRNVRDASRELGIPVGVLFDLQGPKIRLGDLAAGGRQIVQGEEVVFAVRREAAEGELPSGYDGLDRDLCVGDPLLVNDGVLAFEVLEVTPGSVRCVAKNDGLVSSRKGINLPASVVSAPAITSKDRADALFAVEQGVDALALSFVRSAADVIALQEFLSEHDAALPIVAKIEKPQALQALDGILDVAWGVMVARGDLGVELSPEEVPMAQKEIIRRANARGRPVITATQMLESMTENPRPTRAEASDVANAVLDGTDAVMLSAETAVGRYPTETVDMMARIIEATEEPNRVSAAHLWASAAFERIPEAIADSAVHVADHLSVRAIAVFTRSGASAVLVSQRRPREPLLAFTPDSRVRDLLTLVWGVHAWIIPDTETLDECINLLDGAVLKEGLAQRNDLLVICMGAPTAPSGSTSLVMVHHVGAAALR